MTTRTFRDFAEAAQPAPDPPIGAGLLFEQDGQTLFARWYVDEEQLHVDSPLGSAMEPLSMDGEDLQDQAERLARELIQVRESWPFV